MVGFSFSLSQVTVPLGSLPLRVLWTKGLILEIPFGRDAVHIPSPSYQSQQHHSHQGTALGRSCRIKTPNPFFKLWNRVQRESKWPPLTPKGKTEGLPWKRGLILWMTVSSLLPVLKPHPTALYPVQETITILYLDVVGGDSRKEISETCPSMNEQGHGWGAHGSGTMGCEIRVTVRGEQNKNFGHGNLHYQCEQPAFLLHLRML